MPRPFTQPVSEGGVAPFHERLDEEDTRHAAIVGGGFGSSSATISAMRPDFDAIVIGAGPAGSTTARELAASGARTLLLDRATFPRYKPCGGGIPLRTERLLPFPIDPVIEDSVDTLRVTCGGKHGFNRRSRGPFAHMVMRDRFDNLLLEEALRAGAEFRPSSVVRGVEEAGDGVSVLGEDGFSATAQVVVCADGAHSPAGKSAGLGMDLTECAAWEVELSVPEHRAGGTALIDLSNRPWGYGWLFPKAGSLSFGMVLPPGQAGSLKERTAELIASTGFSGASTTIAKGHKVRFRRGNERIASSRVLLTGDAAGLADEFTQEGIYYAIQGGRIAARSVLRTLRGETPLDRYQAEIDAEVMPELRAARLIAYMFYGMLRRAPRPWMFASGHTGFLWSAFFAAQRGESTYAREVERVPVLPWAARRLMGRHEG